MIVILLVLGMLTPNVCAAQRLNPPERGGLRETVRLEVMELDTWGAENQPYAHRLTITDTGVLDGLIDALDANVRVTLKVQCIPEYELRLLLADGTTQVFGYGATFERGK